MIKSLRNRHRQTWLAWAFLLPTGIIFAWLAIPNQAAVKFTGRESQPPLPEIIHTADKPGYTLHIRTETKKKNWQLEWKNKAPLKTPSAVIYRISPGLLTGEFDPSKAVVVGRIEARGDYIFPLPQDSTGHQPMVFLLYDFIHEKIIDTIHL